MGLCARNFDSSYPLEPLLIQYWDAAKYQADGGLKEDSDNLELVSSAVLSPYFWSYCKMCSLIQGILESFTQWCEACTCCTAAARRRRKARGAPGHMFRTCPMAGRKAYCFASGEWLGVFHSLVNTTRGLDLHSIVSSDLSEEEKSIILQDFDGALLHIESLLQLKFRFWQTLPWKLAGVGSPVPSVGRMVAKESLELFSICPIVRYHHRVTSKILAEGTACRRELGPVFAELPPSTQRDPQVSPDANRGAGGGNAPQSCECQTQRQKEETSYYCEPCQQAIGVE